MSPLITQLALCLTSTILGIAAYDQVVVRPVTAMGVVDTVQVYREMESQLVKSLSANASEAQRAGAATEARRFAERLPVEMARLAEDCACLVMDRTMVAAVRPGMRDLTPLLRDRVRR
jgi:hypothetical protein